MQPLSGGLGGSQFGAESHPSSPVLDLAELASIWVALVQGAKAKVLGVLALDLHPEFVTPRIDWKPGGRQQPIIEAGALPLGTPHPAVVRTVLVCGPGQRA